MNNFKQTFLLLSFLIICSASLILVNAHKNKDATKVQLGVYYESLCPDSRRFWTNQLTPAYRNLSDLFEPKLIPFGKASIEGKQMKCQHGPQECLGNKIHACIIDQSKSLGKSIEAINCMFKHKEFRNPEQAGKDCVANADLSWNSVYGQCANSDRGIELMKRNGELTPPVHYIPYLTIGNYSSPMIQDRAEHSLWTYVCSLYKGTNPDSCKSPPKKKRDN